MISTKVKLKEIAERALEKFDEDVRDDPGSYMDSEGEFSIDKYDVESFIEDILEEKIKEGIIDDYDSELIDDILEFIGYKDIADIQNEVLDQLRDEEEYRRDPLGYHGLSQKDFL